MYNLAAVFSQPPSPSSRSPVIGLKISHKITGSVMTSETTDSNFVIDSLFPRVYLFTVLAVNVLGDGKETSTILTTNGL